MGKVRYNLDFTKIKVKYQNIPIGVKFEIGELQVTPSREQLRYNDASIKLITERLELVFNKQNPIIKYFNYFITC